MEYAVPAAHGPACFAELRELLLRDFPDTWPVEYRTLAADDLWISAASGRATVTISVHETVEKDDRAMFEAAEAVFRRYDGRPHWGKVHYRSGAELAGLYPSYRHWWEVRDRFDPDGRFVTPELELLRP
jgi:FAD/FMN-containing dehydrogenase